MLQEFCATNRAPEPAVSCCDSFMLFMFRVGAVFLMLIVITLSGVAVFFTLREAKSVCFINDILWHYMHLIHNVY